MEFRQLKRGISAMFGNLIKKSKINKDEIAELLKVNPEILIEFESR